MISFRGEFSARQTPPRRGFDRLITQRNPFSYYCSSKFGRPAIKLFFGRRGGCSGWGLFSQKRANFWWSTPPPPKKGALHGIFCLFFSPSNFVLTSGRNKVFLGELVKSIWSACEIIENCLKMRLPLFEKTLDPFLRKLSKSRE